MTIEIEPHSRAERPDEVRRRLVLSGLAGGTAFAMSQNVQAQEKAPSAGLIKAGRGNQLTGKVSVITGGAARGIGRAIAVLPLCGKRPTRSSARRCQNRTARKQGSLSLARCYVARKSYIVTGRNDELIA